MYYSTFLNNARIAFTNLLNLLGLVLQYILKNNIFKFLIHSILLFAVIIFFFKFIGVIIDIFTYKKSAFKSSENTDNVE